MGEDIPKGSVVCVSPVEMKDALPFRIASRLCAEGAEKPSKDELDGWLRCLLSYPVELKCVKNADEKHALAMNLRLEYDAKAHCPFSFVLLFLA